MKFWFLIGLDVLVMIVVGVLFSPVLICLGIYWLFQNKPRQITSWPDRNY